MTDKQVLAVAESVARSTDNPAVREVMEGAARLLREKAASERLYRWTLIGGLAVMALAMLALRAALAAF